MNYSIEKVSGTGSNGYYRSYSTMNRPWCVVIDDNFLRGKEGRVRRFGSIGAAQRAAESAIKAQQVAA